MIGVAVLTWADLAGLFGHFLLLSLLAVGGAITTTPGMHQYIVSEQGWLSDSQFTTSVAIAQAAPGPNVLFVAVLGWNLAGPIGMLATMAGTLLPSTVLALWATRWGQARQQTRGVRAFKTGLAPLTVGLLASTGWVLAEPARGRAGSIALVLGTAIVMTRLRLNPLWAVATGALVGALGYA